MLAQDKPSFGILWVSSLVSTCRHAVSSHQAGELTMALCLGSPY